MHLQSNLPNLLRSKDMPWVGPLCTGAPNYDPHIYMDIHKVVHIGYTHPNLPYTYLCKRAPGRAEPGPALREDGQGSAARPRPQRGQREQREECAHGAGLPADPRGGQHRSESGLRWLPAHAQQAGVLRRCMGLQQFHAAQSTNHSGRADNILRPHSLHAPHKGPRYLYVQQQGAGVSAGWCAPRRSWSGSTRAGPSWMT